MKLKTALGLGCTVLVQALANLPAHAETSRFFELEGFGHFLDGNPESTAVTEEGAIALPPEVKERYSDAAVAFSAATGRGDEVLLAKVDDAQIISVDKSGKEKKLFKVPEGTVTALLSTPEGLFAAAGPKAKIYKVDASGNGQVFYTGEAGYIWGMTAGPEGSLYVVTGEPGTVVKIDKAGKGTVVFQSEQAHLRSVAYNADAGVFVGGGEHAVLYRQAPKDKEFRALYDAGNTEITSIVVQDGAAYIAGVSGAASLVQEDAKHGKAEVRSQVLRVSMDGTSEVLAGSNDEAVFALQIDNQHNVIVATGATGRDDPRGRVYAIDPKRRVISMLYQSPSRRITHMVQLADHAMAAVSAAGGRITQLSGITAKSGEFFTQPYDTGINSRYGLAQVLGVLPRGTNVKIAVRTGQTAEPDATWSDWSKGLDAPGNKAVQVPNGRYVQARLTLEGGGSLTPLVQRVRVAYLRQNMPPFVREVSALRKGVSLLPLPREEPKGKTVSLSDKTDDPRGDDHHPVRARQVLDRGALTIKWVADDPNGDELRYDLLMRSAADATWRLIKADLEDPFYSLKSSQLPDGYYMFQVRANDGRSNPDGMEKSDTRESRAVLVDNTPPKLEKIKVSVSGRKAKITAGVSDAVGPLVELTYALDSGDPRPINPVDGVLDGPSEDIELELQGLAPGAHTLTLRALDEADNEGFGEASFEVK